MAESIVQVQSGVNLVGSGSGSVGIGVSSPPSSSSSRCPWAQLPSSPPTIKSINLTDIMSEQLAEGLQEHEEAIYFKEILGADTNTNGAGAAAIDPVTVTTQDIETTLQELVNAAKFGDCGSDELIAQMLQMQYDREYDTNLKKVEQQYNGKSKVSVSLSNYMLSPSDEAEDSDSDDLMEPKAWDLFEKNEKAFPAMSGRGYVRINNTVVTKHDTVMNQRRNACKVMDFPPCIETGDGASFDMQLSNKVFNRLKVYSKAEEVRRTRLHDKSEKSTSDWAIDAKTKLMLYKMVNNGILAEVYGIVSTGKESIVIYATCPVKEEEEDTTEDDSSSMSSSTCTMNDGSSTKAKTPQEVPVPIDVDQDQVMPSTPASASATKPKIKFDVLGASANAEPEEEECAIKVFKTSLNEFKTRDKYIKDDYRFKDRFSKQNPRKVIHMWAEKEFHNLTRMAKAGIPCPKVILLKKHILVLSFIGKNMKPAPKLKDVKFPHGEEGDALLRSAYEQTIRAMKTMFNECKLVHADLSEFNILWHEKQCYFIDVSQSVEPAHPNALEFLYRDCTNICTFFSKRKLENIHTPESLFTDISGIPLNGDGGTAVLHQIQDYEKNLELLTFATSDKSYPFEYCWEQSHNRDGDDSD